MTSPNPFALSDNNSISNHPFIWGNIAFLAGVPWLLVLSMAGLAVGDPVFPSWLEIFLQDLHSCSSRSSDRAISCGITFIWDYLG